MSTRFQIAALVFMMTNAVAFGIGILPILMIPAFANHAFEAIPAVVLASFVISAPLSCVNKHPRLTPPLLFRSIAWLADRRRGPTSTNTGRLHRGRQGSV